MRYNPIQFLMSYYQRTADFLKSHLGQGELEDKVEKPDQHEELKQRIQELGEIIKRHNVWVGTTSQVYGYDGHQVDSYSFSEVDAYQQDVYQEIYTHSKKERRKARKELKRIGLLSLDEEVKNEIMKQLEIADSERRREIVGEGVIILVSGIVIAAILGICSIIPLSLYKAHINHKELRNRILMNKEMEKLGEVKHYISDYEGNPPYEVNEIYDMNKFDERARRRELIEKDLIKKYGG